MFRRFSAPAVACLCVGLLAGVLVRNWVASSHGEEKAARAGKQHRLSPDTPAAYDPDWEKPYPQYQPVGKALQPFPVLKPGDAPPQDLSGFGGAGRTSLSSVDDVASFAEFYRMCAANKPKVNAERLKYMAQRYHFTGDVTHEATMTRGKPLPVGPVTRLPNGMTWEQLGELGPAAVREKDLFPLG